MPNYSVVYYEEKQKAELFKDLQRQKELGLLVNNAITELPHKYRRIFDIYPTYFEECFKAFNFTVSEPSTGTFQINRIL